MFESVLGFRDLKFVQAELARVEALLVRMDESFAVMLRNAGVEIMHFAFRWVYLRFVSVVDDRACITVWDHLLTMKP